MYQNRKGHLKNTDIWISNNVNYRNRNIAKQNESDHEEWYKSPAKDVNGAKLSHEQPREQIYNSD